MTGGIGFTSLMKSLSRTNRSFLKHPDKVRSQKDNLTYLTDKTALHYKTLSDKELEKYKFKIRQERRTEQRKELYKLLITIFILIAMALTIYVIVKE